MISFYIYELADRSRIKVRGGYGRDTIERYLEHETGGAVKMVDNVTEIRDPEKVYGEFTFLEIPEEFWS
jgi:hypothetical protein